MPIVTASPPKPARASEQFTVSGGPAAADLLGERHAELTARAAATARLVADLSDRPVLTFAEECQLASALEAWPFLRRALADVTAAVARRQCLPVLSPHPRAAEQPAARAA